MLEAIVADEHIRQHVSSHLLADAHDALRDCEERAASAPDRVADPGEPGSWHDRSCSLHGQPGPGTPSTLS